MAMLYRLILRARRPLVRQWDLTHAGPWDKAVPGQGAATAVYDEELTTELAILEGSFVGEVLLDMEKF